MLAPWDGNDSVVIYLKDSKQYKRLPANRNVSAQDGLLDALKEKYGEKNIKVVEKAIENIGKID